MGGRQFFVTYSIKSSPAPRAHMSMPKPPKRTRKPEGTVASNAIAGARTNHSVIAYNSHSSFAGEIFPPLFPFQFCAQKKAPAHKVRTITRTAISVCVKVVSGVIAAALRHG